MTQTILWNTSKPIARKNNPRKHETCVDVVCACGNVRPVPEYKARKPGFEDKTCGMCQRKAASAKVDYDARLEAQATSQWKRMTEPEQKARNILRDDLKLTFQQQVVYRANGIRAILDFMIDAGEEVIILEINGWHHRQYRQERDARLQEVCPHRVVFVDAEAVDVTTLRSALALS